jgi:hypothetical protein
MTAPATLVIAQQYSSATLSHFALIPARKTLGALFKKCHYFNFVLRI